MISFLQMQKQTKKPQILDEKVPPETRFLDALGEAFFILDHKFCFVYANARYQQLMGSSEENLRGKSFLEFHPGAQRSSLPELFLAVRQSSLSTTFDDYNVALKRWFEYHISGHPNGFTVSVLDVTNRKTEQLAIRKREEQIRDVLEQSPIGIGRVSLDGCWMGMNARCAQILGVDKEKIVGAPYVKICLPEDIEKDELGFASLVRKETEALISERQILKANHESTWVQLKVSLIWDALAKPKFFVVILEDIAERKEVEESLQFALEGAQMGTWDFDAINNLTRRCSRFDEIFGYKNPVHSWTYRDFLNHLFPEDLPFAKKTLQEALAHGQKFSLETRIVWPDKSVHWISLRGRVYLNQHGRAIQLAGTVMDITAQKVREEDLHKARQAAEEANAAKSSFLANMSHEIRTPLGAILGFTDMLLETNASPEELQKYLKIIQRNGKNLAVLVDDILDLSKVEAGHLEVEKRDVDVLELLQNIETLFRLKAESKGLQLKIEIDPSVPSRVKTDSVRLRQILLNIVGNAIKFTESGSVVVQVRGMPGNPQPLMAFIVKDTGAGIPREHAQRLFQPFTQADSSTTRKFGGTGLGLALSRKLARALGGDVVLSDSQLGIGTTFTIVIAAETIVDASEKPAQAPESETAPPLPLLRPPIVSARGTSAYTKRLEGLQILVADDSPDNRLLISRILNRGGATIDLADDGNIAVEKARANNYDVVVMDMQMPNLDGYNATRKLREEGFEGPIVALTANAMRNDRERCLQAGCSEYLPKPIDPLRLFQILGNLTHTTH